MIAPKTLMALYNLSREEVHGRISSCFPAGFAEDSAFPAVLFVPLQRLELRQPKSKR